MDNTIYPLKFKPILKDKIWGGSKLRNNLNKSNASEKCGESWEISGIPGDLSVVKNGWLEGNTIEEVIEVYMGDLIGENVFNNFGTTFPLLIKFIDANDDLSIQVHPNDQLALERHQSFGKTEMWYIIENEENAELIIGFKREVTQDEYIQSVTNAKLEEILNKVKVSSGDVYFMPAGRIHAIGSGIVLAEIQQTSDITYRIYDYNRKDNQGNERELHTDLAVDAIDFNYHEECKTIYETEKNKSSRIVECDYFTTNIIELDQKIKREYHLLDSFVIYMCIEGNCILSYPGGEESINQGETILIPAIFEEIDISPKQKTKILEVYIKN